MHTVIVTQSSGLFLHRHVFQSVMHMSYIVGLRLSDVNNRC